MASADCATACAILCERPHLGIYTQRNSRLLQYNDKLLNAILMEIFRLIRFPPFSISTCSGREPTEINGTGYQ